MLPLRSWWRRWFGSRSERAAASFLRRLGYRLLASNVHNRFGELDLIALDGRTVVFVEVRSTEKETTLEPGESIDATKQQKLTRAALAWLKDKRLLDHAARFDALLIAWPAGAREPRIEHVRHAFDAMGRGQMYS
jgi:putative endonuclease